MAIRVLFRGLRISQMKIVEVRQVETLPCVAVGTEVSRPGLQARHDGSTVCKDGCSKLFKIFI